MKKKKRDVERQSHRMRTVMFLGACLIVIALFATISYQDQQHCEAFQSYHPVRVIVYNHYDETIWINVIYSNIEETDTWVINGNSKKIVYTKHTFQPDSNVTVTFQPTDANGRYLPNTPALVVRITPDLSLVYDDNYQKDLTQRDPSIDLKCVTDQVYEGPTITLQS